MFHTSNMTPRSYDYYLMAKPPPDVAGVLYDCGVSVLRGGGKPVRIDRLHLTLLQLAKRQSPDLELIKAAKEALQGFDCAPMRLVVDQMVCADRGQLLLKPEEALRGFVRVQNALVAALCGTLGIHLSSGPHVTLGYEVRPFAAVAIEPISWVQDEILLIESHVGVSRHVIRGRWPLGGSDCERRAA